MLVQQLGTSWSLCNICLTELIQQDALLMCSIETKDENNHLLLYRKKTALGGVLFCVISHIAIRSWKPISLKAISGCFSCLWHDSDCHEVQTPRIRHATFPRNSGKPGTVCPFVHCRSSSNKIQGFSHSFVSSFSNQERLSANALWRETLSKCLRVWGGEEDTQHCY